MNYEDEKLREPKTLNPDTGKPETKFRAAVRDVLGLSWDARDVALFAELKRLKQVDENLTANQNRQRKLA